MAGPMKKVTPWSPAGNNTGDAKQISCHSHHEFKGFKGYSSENITRWKRSLCAHGSLTDWRDNLLLTDCVRPSIQGAEPACWCRGSIPQTVETASFPKSATLTISHDLPTAVPQHNLKSLPRRVDTECNNNRAIKLLIIKELKLNTALTLQI